MHRPQRTVSAVPPGEEDWGAVIGRVAAGDREAFARLFRHFAPRVRAFLVRGTKPPLDAARADELVQETLLRVWQRAATFDSRKSAAATWIYTVARNCRTDLIYRRRMQDSDRVMAEDIWEAETVAQSALDELERAREQHEVRCSVAQLPPEQSEAIRLVYMGAKSHAEVAEALAVPIGTIKSRIRLGMTKLRALLEVDR